MNSFLLRLSNVVILSICSVVADAAAEDAVKCFGWFIHDSLPMDYVIYIIRCRWSLYESICIRSQRSQAKVIAFFEFTSQFRIFNLSHTWSMVIFHIFLLLLINRSIQNECSSLYSRMVSCRFPALTPYGMTNNCISTRLCVSNTQTFKIKSSPSMACEKMEIIIILVAIHLKFFIYRPPPTLAQP